LNTETVKNKQIGRLQDLGPLQNKALLVGTFLSGKVKTVSEEQLDELESLGKTFGLQTVFKLICPIKEYDPGTFIGKGKIEEIRALIQEHQANLVIFDDEISPQQQRNLEKALEIVVIDRTELILAVFAQRAHTREAKIQIELAYFQYQLPRLRRLWTHLSRQRSGGSGSGFTKGEGEKQIEIDRRILRRKLDSLHAELNEVKKHRKIQRKARERNQIPIFAIVGYTNVGKSTLLNALTQAGVLVEDKLFATLDTTTRKFVLPNRQEVLLIDTVGFIRKIPHLLVASFKSTLEEALQADILLHLVDANSPTALLQAEATCDVLKELGADKKPVITVLNKVDACKGRETIQQLRFKYPKTVEISALEKKGFDHLTEQMIHELSLLRKVVRLRVPQSHYGLVTEVLAQGKVISCDYEENDILLEVEIPHVLEGKVAPFVVS
jgi:GTP-binding protein HflX